VAESGLGREKVVRGVMAAQGGPGDGAPGSVRCSPGEFSQDSRHLAYSVVKGGKMSVVVNPVEGRRPYDSLIGTGLPRWRSD